MKKSYADNGHEPMVAWRKTRPEGLPIPPLKEYLPPVCGMMEEVSLPCGEDPVDDWRLGHLIVDGQTQEAAMI